MLSTSRFGGGVRGANMHTKSFHFASRHKYLPTHLFVSSFLGSGYSGGCPDRASGTIVAVSSRGTLPGVKPVDAEVIGRAADPEANTFSVKGSAVKDAKIP